MDLRTLGWDDAREAEFAPLRATGVEPARVATEDKHHYGVLTATRDFFLAQVPGRFLHRVRQPADLPKVGDWVAIRPVPDEDKAHIEQVLARRTQLSRKEAGREIEEQLLVANVDAAFLVHSLDRKFNPRLLQRQLVMVRDGGVQAVVLLNKTDVCDAVEARVAEAGAVAAGARVIAVSAKTRRGLPQLREHLKPAQTVVFLGASGVGKSTLINRLFGDDVQATTEVRERDSKGRHTTTWRELIVLPGGALVIDTPGMREVQIWLANEGVPDAFPDIAALGLGCHFRDCSHAQEQRCAVQAALADGRLARERYDQYLKLAREFAFLEKARAQQGYAARNRSMRVAQRAFNKLKRQG